MSSTIEIIPLEQTPKNVLRFLSVSYRIYTDDPLWVAPLLSDLSTVLNKENPFFEHARIQLWVARQNGEDLGRIAGVIDPHFESKLNTIGFGFFETPPDPAIARALFNAFHDWAKSNGAENTIGPLNPSTNDECGLLIDGFQHRPVFMMPHNPDYYQKLIEAEGYAKARDLFAFDIDLTKTPMERLLRLTSRLRKRNAHISIRAVTKSSLKKDLPRIVALYNDAWEQNWGFVKMTPAEMNFLAKRLTPLLVEGFVQVAEENGQVVGFLVAVPDVNEIIKPLKGRFLSPGIFKALPYLIGWKHPRGARVIALGVKAELRGRGIESVMLADGLSVAAKLGYQRAEAGWVLEDNHKSRGVIEAVGGNAYKTYRIFTRIPLDEDE